MTEALVIDEFTAVGAWVVTKLKAEFGDAQLIRFNGMKEGDTGRAIVYSIVPLPDLTTADGDTAITRFSVTVRAVEAGPSAWPLGPYAKRINNALHGSGNEAMAGGYTLKSCRRESPFSPEPVVFRGVEHQVLGASFRVLVQ